MVVWFQQYVMFEPHFSSHEATVIRVEDCFGQTFARAVEMS